MFSSHSKSHPFTAYKAWEKVNRRIYRKRKKPSSCQGQGVATWSGCSRPCLQPCPDVKAGSN